jgi:hypothetical protein
MVYDRHGKLGQISDERDKKRRTSRNERDKKRRKGNG